MQSARLILAALICCVTAIGAGEQPNNPHAAPPAKQPDKPAADQKQPEAKPLPPAKPEDVKTIDALIKAFYSSTAGEPGQARNWDRFRSLFVSEARMMPVRHAVHGQGGNELLTMPVEDYISLNKNYFEKGGFVEREVARRTETFGNIAQVWSTYESRRSEKEKDPYVRGVYSIQLANDGERWFILNVMWDTEQENAKLPEKYLKPAAD